jgi:Mg2+/Co2+ transporter CorB
MTEIILGLIAIICQAFFAGSETAYSRANWIRLSTWKKTRPTISFLRFRVNQTFDLLAHKEEIIIITLIFTNLFIVIASTIFSRFFIIRFGSNYTIVAIILVVLLSVTIGDFFPKIIAQAFPNYWAIFAGPIMQMVYKILSPLLPKPKTERYHKLSRRDFLYFLKEQKTQDSLVINQIAKALFDFTKITIGEIMVPNARVIGLVEDDKFVAVKKIVEKYRFSRYPVFQRNTGEIVGIVHIKDLLMAERRKKVDISKILRKPYYVRSEEKAMPVLKTMSKKGEHLALVQNENKEVIGIITLEDLLEEVVGEIRSET